MSSRFVATARPGIACLLLDLHAYVITRFSIGSETITGMLKGLHVNHRLELDRAVYFKYLTTAP